ncbi:MAG: substrate-binding domain-containing protein [Candidatus Caldatribacteriaceae bacterium]
MKRLILGFMVLTFVVFSVLGSVAWAEDLTIGLSFPSLSFAWFAFLEQAVKDKAAQLGGIEVISLEAENSVSKQISIIEDMIVKGVNGVLLVPIEVEAIIPGIEALNKANVPVVTVDRRIKEGAPVQVLCHVGADNVEGGRKAARFIVEKLTEKYGEPKGMVIELTGTPGAGPAIDRSAGFNEIIKQYPNITVKSQTANFRREDGMKVMEDFIMSTPQIDAVFGANDEMVLGAIQAIEASGKLDVKEVVTVGFDALPEALKLIKEGILDATIEQFPGKQASTAFEILVKYLREKAQPEKPLVYIEPKVITKDNLNEAEKSF